MGEVIRFTNHKLSKCDDSCNGCFVCEGGLALCTVCGGAESSLSTHCPGEKMSAQTANFVSSGVIDGFMPPTTLLSAMPEKIFVRNSG